MIFGIVFIIVFVIGFTFGIIMPFILEKMNIYKKEDVKKEENNSPSTNVTEIVDEWFNGGRGE